MQIHSSKYLFLYTIIATFAAIFSGTSVIAKPAISQDFENISSDRDLLHSLTLTNFRDASIRDDLTETGAIANLTFDVDSEHLRTAEVSNLDDFQSASDQSHDQSKKLEMQRWRTEAKRHSLRNGLDQPISAPVIESEPVTSDIRTLSDARLDPALTFAAALVTDPNESPSAVDNADFDSDFDSELTSQSIETAQDIDPGRTTRTGSSYIGVGANAGFGDGDDALSEFSFAAFAKIGFTPDISLRPSVIIRDNVSVLVPITLDFFQRDVGPVEIGPYFGGGLAISTGDDSEVGPLLSAGVDVPIDNRFTGTLGFNLAFFDNLNAGFLLGVGYNF
ncbi:MAG: hypothetical protein ACFE0I_01775 [Elainellaceae cyanobacterium]